MIKKLKTSFRPTFSEIYLYLVSLILLLFFFMKPSVQNEVLEMTFYSGDVGGVMRGGLLLLIVLYPVYHIFNARPKSLFAKEMMLTLAISVNAIVGIVTGFHVLLEASQLIYVVFPALNIFTAYTLLLLWGSKKINRGAISDQNAMPLEIIVGSLGVLIIFFITQIQFNLYWALTISICLTFASVFNSRGASNVINKM